MSRCLMSQEPNSSPPNPHPAGLLEKYNGTSHRHLGATFQNIVREQFELIRDGDRFFYDQKDVLHEDTRVLVKEMTLWDVIKRNANVSDIYVSNAFTMADPATCSAERKEGSVSVEKGKKMLQSGSEVAWKVVSSDTVCFHSLGASNSPYALFSMRQMSSSAIPIHSLNS